MGLGKTAQTLAAVDALRPSGGFAVICPAVVAPHWEAQIAKWAPHLEPRCGFVLSYEKASRRIRKGEAPSAGGLVVLDEIHYCMSPKAKRTQAIREWLAGNDAPQAQRPLVLGLSGTPMTARPRDLWQPLDLLWPGRFGRWWDFTHRYCDGHDEEIPGAERVVYKCDGASNVDELAGRLTHCMLRRTKQTAGVDLPPRTRVVIEVPLSSRARKATLEAARLVSGASLGKLLSQLEAHKLRAAEQLAQDALTNGQRPLLFTTRKATARELANRLACPCVTGEQSVRRRVASLADAPCAVATMYALQVGIDLTQFDVVIFVGLDWVPSTLLQAEARAHRLGQSKQVTCYYLIALGSADEIVRERVIERLDTFATLTNAPQGDEAQFAGELSGSATDDELLAALVAEVKGST
jgi:SNF2 family DNA or RNA helicase